MNQAKLGLSRPLETVFVLAALVGGVLVATLPLQAAGVLLLAAGIILLGIVHPLIAVGAALWVGPLAAYENIALGNLPVDSGQLFFAFAVGSWLLWSIGRRRVVLRMTPLNLPLALFIGLGLLSLLDAPSLSYGLKAVLKWLEIGLFMLIVLDLVISRAQSDRHRTSDSFVAFRQPIRLLVALLLSAGMSQALLGVYQFGFQEEGPDHFAIFGDYYRAYGTFMQPNPFGGFMGLLTALAVGTLVGVVMAHWPEMKAWLCRRGQMKAILHGDVSWMLFLVLAVVLCGVALLLSWSRGAWLGFAAGMVVLLFFLPRRRIVGLALLLGAGLLFLVALELNLVPASISARLGGFQEDVQFGDVRGVDISEENYAVIERLAHWQTALDMARSEPWLGVGLGNYEPAYAEYQLINWPHPLGHAHNYYLNILAEMGVIGTLSYVLLWVLIFRQTIWLLNRLEWPERGVVLGLLASWTALSVHHLLDNLYVNNLYLHLGAMLGILQALFWAVRNTQPDSGVAPGEELRGTG